MKDINFKVNSRIDIVWDEVTYKSIILDLTEEYLAIAIPSKDGIPLPLHEEDVIEAIYYQVKEITGFRAKVKSRTIEGRLPMLFITLPQKLKEVQRRNFVRIQTYVSIQYVKITKIIDVKVAERILMENKGINTTIQDISGGGLKVKQLENVVDGDVILLEIQLEGCKVRAKGKVIRHEGIGKDNNFYGVSFEDIENGTREKIIQYIFGLMRKSRGII